MDKKYFKVFDNETDAIKAVDQLKNEGFTSDQISVIAKNTEKLPNDAEEVAPTATDGLVAGAAAGGAVGLTGILIGMSALAIPGIGPILAAGPILTTFGGAAAGAVSGAGGLKKPLQDLGLEEEEADRYLNDIKNGKILVVADPTL